MKIIGAFLGFCLVLAVGGIVVTQGLHPDGARDMLAENAPELHRAALAGDMNSVQQLLNSGTQPGLRDRLGNTALHPAASMGHLMIARLLIEAGIDINATNELSFTPLHQAAAFGQYAMAELLIAKGADVNARQAQGATALHLAAMSGHEDMVDLLIGAQAEVNAPNDSDATPLDLAILMGEVEIVGLLLDRGAIVSDSTSGQSSLALAKQLGHDDVVAILAGAPAEPLPLKDFDLPEASGPEPAPQTAPPMRLPGRKPTLQAKRKMPVTVAPEM